MKTIPYDLKTYPCTDGKPMAESSLQAKWIATTAGGLKAIFADNPNVFVAMDMFWYPVEGKNKIKTAPDVFVVFGRPKEERLSYLQFIEENVPPQVVIEILSPSNRPKEMAFKFEFYEKYGVEEYYIYNPHKPKFTGFLRKDGRLKEIPNIERGWTSPLLDVHFELDGELIITGPDGNPFLTYEVLAKEKLRAEETSEQNRKQAALERKRAELQAKRAEQEARRAEQEAKSSAAMSLENEKLKALLRANGIDPDKVK